MEIDNHCNIRAVGKYLFSCVLKIKSVNGNN